MWKFNGILGKEVKFTLLITLVKVKTKTKSFEPNKIDTVNHKFKIKWLTTLLSFKPLVMRW